MMFGCSWFVPMQARMLHTDCVETNTTVLRSFGIQKAIGVSVRAEELTAYFNYVATSPSTSLLNASHVNVAGFWRGNEAVAAWHSPREAAKVVFNIPTGGDAAFSSEAAILGPRRHTLSIDDAARQLALQLSQLQQVGLNLKSE